MIWFHDKGIGWIIVFRCKEIILFHDTVIIPVLFREVIKRISIYTLFCFQESNTSQLWLTMVFQEQFPGSFIQNIFQCNRWKFRCIHTTTDCIHIIRSQIILTQPPVSFSSVQVSLGKAENILVCETTYRNFTSCIWIIFVNQNLHNREREVTTHGIRTVSRIHRLAEVFATTPFWSRQIIFDTWFIEPVIGVMTHIVTTIFPQLILCIVGRTYLGKTSTQFFQLFVPIVDTRSVRCPILSVRCLHFASGMPLRHEITFTLWATWRRTSIQTIDFLTDHDTFLVLNNTDIFFLEQVIINIFALIVRINTETFGHQVQSIIVNTTGCCIYCLLEVTRSQTYLSQ